MNRDHPVIFEIAPKYCISDSFVDYEGYSISSKKLLPTVVDAISPFFPRSILDTYHPGGFVFQRHIFLPFLKAK